MAELVTRHLNGTLSTEDARALNQRLAADRPSRVLFVRFSRLHGLLTEHAIVSRQSSDPGWDLGSTADEQAQADLGNTSLHDAIVQTAIRAEEPIITIADLPVGPAEPEPEFQTAPYRLRIGFRWMAGIAAVAALAVGVASLRRSPANVAFQNPVPVRPTLADAAKVVASVDGDLQRANGKPLAVGDLMPDEQISLRSGWARLDFRDGASVVVEAPAAIRVLSASELSVTAGRVTALVPPAAHGFAVAAPACRVVDLGTEFGIDVLPTGRTDVAVFRGSVSLKGSATNSAEVLTVGQGRRFATVNSPAVATDVVASEFVRVEQFDRWSLAAAPTGAPADRLRAAEEQLCRDPALDLYYTFRDGAAKPEIVANAAPGTAGKYELSLAGTHAPTWAEGRLPGFSSLDFSPARKQRLMLSEFPITQTGQISCTAWVFCRAHTPFGTIAKNWGSHLGGAFHFGLNHEGTDLQVQLDGGLQDPTAGTPDAIVLTDDAGENPFPVGRWVHVAFTSDGREVNLYRDGELVRSGASRPIAPKQPFKALTIGFKANDDTSDAEAAGSQVGFWDGRIGTLALFHRALSAEEIKRLYTTGLAATTDGSPTVGH